MIKRISMIGCLLLCGGLAMAEIKFDLNALHLGQVEWYAQTRAVVTMENNSQKPVKIVKVLTSSGQVTPEWDNQPIASGAQAALNLNFKADMLGHFEKAIYVYTDDQQAPYVLKFTGQVVQVKHNYQGDFPYKVGNLLLSTENIEFDDVSRGENPEVSISVRNDGQEIYHPELMHMPKYMTQRAEPEKLLPGRSGCLFVTLNSEEIEGFGLNQTSVYLSRFPGDKVGKDNELVVSSIILPPVDTTSKVQIAMAPHLEMNQTELELPALDKKSKVKGFLLLNNVGKSNLEIRTLQVFNPAVNVDLGHLKIAPGRSEKLKISVLAKYMNKSRGRLRVLMITNDPEKLKVIINVKLAKQ